uniref:BTB domain-containing protein n=5 Tax=Lotharella globosa TaxID=91324 RepID=A0A7S4DK60_9EUKA|mmetsp:Transcript_22407/g.44969  ORF Transcript_22407/g.44969 Transcript_22407/m.44969 type:complete len:431 (-) Transcript_22407:452-1744(-)
MPPSLLASSSEDVLPSLLPVAKDLRFSRNAGAKRAFDHDLGIPGSKRQRTRALSPDHASSLDDEENEPSRSNVASAAGVACLNIGGTRFITTLSTLSTVEDSMLAKLFNGRFSTTALPSDKKDTPYACFIDRSPEVFGLILDYLRIGPDFQLPRAADVRRKLLIEAKFYGLTPLVQMLEAPIVTKFDYRFDGDTNGIFFHLGTLRSKEWANPGISGEVRITASRGMCQNLESLSSDEDGEVEGPISKLNFPLALYCGRPSQEFPKKPFRFFELSSCDAYDSSDGAWVAFDFGKRRVNMTRYTLRYGDCYGLGGCWDWHGSNDGKEWELVQNVRNDFHLNCEHPQFPKQFHVPTTIATVTTLKRLKAIRRRAILCSHTFPVKESKSFYRYLRISKPRITGGVKTKTAKHDQCCLHFWGLEIYGSLSTEEMG